MTKRGEAIYQIVSNPGDKINDAAQGCLCYIANNTMSEYFCPVLWPVVWRCNNP